MKRNLLYEYPLDPLIAGDEWDHMRYLIGEWLECCESKYPLTPIDDLPFLPYFYGKMRDKLIKAGFDREALEDPHMLGIMLSQLDKQGLQYNCPVWQDPPYFFPPGSFTISSDNTTMWVNEDIDAALRTLGAIAALKDLLVKDGVVDKNAVKVYLRSLELIVNLSRAGAVPKLARMGANMLQNSDKKKDIKKKIMRVAISNIFQKYPKTPKTLGGVWVKFDPVNKNIIFQNPQIDKGQFRVKTGKNSKGEDAAIITKDGKYFSHYKRRSLQHFIDELK